MLLDKAGRTRKSAGSTKTCWEKTEETNDRLIVTKVFIDVLNPVTPTNKRALIQTQVFQGKYWQPEFHIISNENREISIAEALEWCQQNEGQTTGLCGEEPPVHWRIVQQRLGLDTAAA